jgi:thioredoxin 1
LFAFLLGESTRLNITDWLGKADLQKLKDSPGVHFVLFAAEWCGFCRRFLEQAASLQAPNETVLSLVNADDPDESLWDEYSLRAVPTLVVFKGGKSVFRKDARLGGGLRLAELQQALDEIPA